MAKAFFKEDTVPDEPPPVAPRPSEPLPITAAGHARLVAERGGLDAKSEKDRSRALALDRILATTFVRPVALHEGGAGFGCFVEVQDERGKRTTYQLVGPDEVEPKLGRISEASPLGAALLGRRAGETVVVERAGREDELTIRAVRLP